MKTVLITGASTGIGRAAAEKFAAEGWNVAATMRTPDAVAAFHDPAKRIRTLRLDVTDPKSIANGIKAATEAFGGIDVLVNNAGYSLVGPFESMDDAEIRRQFETNLFGLMAVTRAVLPAMRAAKGGVIVNVASVGGRLTFPYYSIYHATKWAVDGFSESLAFELAEQGIRVRIVEPGPIRTDFYTRSEDRIAPDRLGVYRESFTRVGARMRRIGETAPGPEVVAQAIWKAATSRSDRLRYLPAARMMMAARRFFNDTWFHDGVRMYLGMRKWQRPRERA